MQITWPSPQEYNEAIQNPSLAFIDPELQHAKPELNQLGLPRPTTGSFAIVYQMMCSYKNWAVRCFLKSAYNQELRYGLISKHLAQTKLSSVVDFEYQPNGIKYRGRHLPIVKMEWINGITLDNFVRVAHGNSAVMRSLAERFLQLYESLQVAGIAHGDLQHGNLLVTETELRLVDYDGMYVPSLAGALANELGHRNYQHPLRTNNTFGPYLDNFSAWIILISLYVLSIDSSLWKDLAGGDECLLFRQTDFRLPFQSKAFSLLASHKNNEVRELSLFLQKLLDQPPEYIPAPTRYALPLLMGQPHADLSAYLTKTKEQAFEKSDANKTIKASNSSITNVFQSNQTAKIKSEPNNLFPKDSFVSGNYAQAAEYYKKMLVTLANQEARSDIKPQLECSMQLGYCYIYLNNMAEALPLFRNNQVLAKSHNFFDIAMRCIVCIALIYSAQGNGERAIQELERNSPSQSDMLVALKAELAGPLTNNHLLSDLMYLLAQTYEKKMMANAVLFYNMALESYTKTVGNRCLQRALCLHRRAVCDTGSGIKASSEQDLNEAMDIVLSLEGPSSKHVNTIKLDLVRLFINNASQHLQDGYIKETESLLIKAFSELSELEFKTISPAELKKLLLMTLTTYINTKNTDFLTTAINALTDLFPNQLDLTRFFISSISHCLAWNKNNEAETLLTKTFSQLNRLQPKSLPPLECKELLSDTLSVYAKTMPRNTSLLIDALHAFNHIGSLNEQELSRLIDQL